MSRIHEALKKAEEQRLANQAAPAAPKPAGDELASPAPPLTTGSGPAAAAAALSPAVTLNVAAAPIATPATEETLTWEIVQARCPRREWRPDNHMLFLNGAGHDEYGMEQFRTLRSRLYQIRANRPLKAVLVGSALPAEGKTFVAANLAQSLVRQHGRRALLIDGDLRKPRLHEALGAPAEPGLHDYLAGRADEVGIMQRGPLENLLVIPGGRPAPNPSELAASTRFRQLIQRLSPLFDWIIVDSPPVVPVSDAVQMASACDGVLLVVQAATTPFDMAQKARKEFHLSPLLGVVLNRVTAGLSYTSYYAYRSSYVKHYGSGEAKP